MEHANNNVRDLMNKLIDFRCPFFKNRQHYCTLIGGDCIQLNERQKRCKFAQNMFFHGGVEPDMHHLYEQYGTEKICEFCGEEFLGLVCEQYCCDICRRKHDAMKIKEAIDKSKELFSDQPLEE